VSARPPRSVNAPRHRGRATAPVTGVVPERLHNTQTAAARVARLTVRHVDLALVRLT